MSKTSVPMSSPPPYSKPVIQPQTKGAMSVLPHVEVKQPAQFVQSFAGAKITTGSGGKGHGRTPGGRGGDVGSHNQNVNKQIFDRANLKTGDGGNASRMQEGARAGDIGAHHNPLIPIAQDFTRAVLGTGPGGSGSGRGGDIGAGNCN